MVCFMQVTQQKAEVKYDLILPVNISLRPKDCSLCAKRGNYDKRKDSSSVKINFRPVVYR
jgi:hypothetical protein